MEKELKLQYFERLIAPNNSKKYFIEQFLQGSGNELVSKFWKDSSSSRLCFDLYSWLCNVQSVSNFQFEKKLNGVRISQNKTATPPNMDAYFEKEQDIFFIESKYTEKSSWNYMDENKKGYYLSEAYWKEGGYKTCKLNIGERFYDKPDIAKQFISFCKSIQKEINERREKELKKYLWFDPKQETCHLFGIIFYVINNQLKNKHLYLCNNVWNCNKSEDCFVLEDSLVGSFKDKAETMLNRILEKYECKFTFEVNTIQEILEKGFKGLDFPKAKLFATKEEKLVKYIRRMYTMDNR